MADFLLRDIDERVAERIKEMARQKGWPLNDVILMLIKQALGLAEPEPPPVPGDIARLPGTWNDDESRAFEEAMAALTSARRRWLADPSVDLRAEYDAVLDLLEGLDRPVRRTAPAVQIVRSGGEVRRLTRRARVALLEPWQTPWIPTPGAGSTHT